MVRRELGFNSVMGKAKGIEGTLRLVMDWGFPSPTQGTLLILQISVTIKEIFRLGRVFPWKGTLLQRLPCYFDVTCFRA